MDFFPGVDSTFWKVGRLKTFKHWPYQSIQHSCNPAKMATAGFYAIGGEKEPDLVECFVCSKQLDGWDPDDDPWQEHLKHQPECPFIKLNKFDEAAWTVRELFDLFKIYTVKECTRELECALDKTKEESTRLMHDIPRIYKELKKNSEAFD
ncbi:baculoviral IAP repeat-containing protein 5 isoform X1 [Osmia bicornis bicornis]|uniref:baculoviral IAP repeat-containing protein 5 isoform X1 n=1 Tax=Osmia bicornis bicornis TaxID=1437191 RepID=UPI001EAF13D7|nr:baculoviral IAP repeat-containing protein 5 isoform X1 [Osmia bicornis bicornis]